MTWARRGGFMLHQESHVGCCHNPECRLVAGRILSCLPGTFSLENSSDCVAFVHLLVRALATNMHIMKR